MFPAHASQYNVSWVEAEDESGPINMDIFYDRTVFLTIPEPCKLEYCLVPGVFIDYHLVLTSFNPFRAYFKHTDDPRAIKILVLTGRIRTSPDKDNKHQIKEINAGCARQIVPIPERMIPSNQWHGIRNAHSPLHDLMIIRTYENLTFFDPEPTLHSFDHYLVDSSEYTKAGPLITRLATPVHQVTRNLKFASLAFRDKTHMLESNVLSSREYESDENVLRNCNEWLPKMWGHFICVENIDNYKGVGSGALLFDDNKLFGVGSFLLRKGNQSVLVFTDVRPYNHILNKRWQAFKTCKEFEITTTTKKYDSTSSTVYHSD